MKTAEIAERLNATRTATGWIARCPGHDDKRASLTIAEGRERDGRTVLKCQAGCAFERVVAAAGLTAKDLAPTTPSADTVKPRIVATYDYTDAAGKLLFQVCRFEPKDFRQRRPDGNGGWVWKMEGVERVLYKLPRMVEQVAREGDVFIVEGEKDVAAMERLGLCATCNPGGAGKWQPSFTDSLQGAHVTIIADKDEPGRKHAELVRSNLTGKAAGVAVVELPDRDAVKVKDAADWVAAGGTAAELAEIIANADKAAVTSPEAAPVDAGDWLDAAPPPLAPILDQLFEVADKFEIIGGSKTRKTFFALQAALHLAAGRDFLGWRVDRPWRVLLVQMEVKPRHFHRRVFRLAAALGLKRADLDGRLFILNGRGLKLSGAAFFEYVRKLAEAHRAEIIIFDPLYKITVGDENAAADIKPTLAEFDRLAEATGAAIGYVHHDSKGDAGERNIVDRGAGSGVLARDCDARIILTAHESEADAFVVETVTRNFPPQDGFTIGWGDTETGYCFQTMPEVAAVKRTRKSQQAGPRLSALVDQCADLIGKPITKGDLVAKIRARTGAGRDKALAILKGLEIRPGVACRRANAKGAQWYIGEEKQMEFLPGEGRT